MRSFMREKKIYCGKHYREVDIYPYTAAQLTASTRGKRSKKIKETEPKQKNLNDKNARRYFTQTANLNFGSDPEALHVTATYSGKYLPDTVEQAEQEATNFLRRVQYRRKKEGLPPLKYMIVTAYTTKRNSETPVRIHHHIIMNGGLDRDVVEDLWRKRRRKGQKKGDKIGFCNADRLQADENGIAALCTYLVKQGCGKKRWNSSHIMCQSYAEAVAALGYSDDWEKYPICEAIYSQFKLYGVAPVVFVNVLDPAKHKKSVAEQNYPVADGKVLLPLEALKNTVKVTSYTAGTDYELFYEGENLILEVLDGGSIPAETGELTITFDAVDPSKINENDIIGGFDTSTKKYSGLELIDKVFPKYGIVPDLIVAPGWSDKSNVAAVMTAKADAINTVFTGAKALIDADTNTVRHYADVPAWKKAQNMNSKAEILCWPMFGLGDRVFHASVHAAGLMGKTDSDNGGCPAESPSNKSLQIDRAMLADGTTVLLDLAQANYLNSNGIVTALNFIGSYVLWGDETACFPADTDVKNYFISVSRMFGWVARSVILTYWSKIDKKMTRRLIDSIVDSVNIWLNGLVSEEKLLGARVEFLDEENSTTALMAGKAVFHIYMTPASPMRECEFVLEYDADYVTAALSA